MRTIPTRSATTPQTNLPAAPPAKSTASARPSPATVSPLASSRNGRNVRSAVRVAVSIMPIAASAWKPRASRMPQPPAERRISSVARAAAARPKPAQRDRR